jgi:WD40 repeat protein
MQDTVGTYTVSRRPYPGLRAFRKEESDIFFGRDEHVDLLLKKLGSAHFVCVTGPSGCGKSSLVRTGLQNALEAGFLAGRGSDWIFCDFNPGDQPLDALTRSLAKACAEYVPAQSATETSASAADEVHSMLTHGITDVRQSNDLNRVLSVLDLGGRPILLFVDQFEELFRYAQREPNAAVRFVEILLQTAAAKANIYVVITIRTDELEKCSRYTGLTRVINESQFLTPTLDRYQIQEAIEGPIAIFGGKIDPKLTIWLLNSLDEELDKLPLMQHALKLLYAHKSGSEGRPDVHLTIEDFVGVFRLDPKIDFSHAESRFALRATLERRLEKIYHGLPDDRLKRAAARLFCALTAFDGGSRDIRRPLPLSKLALTIGVSEPDARAIIDAFASGDESYLIVKGDKDGTVDVPHECILRLWPRLQTKWLANERESADNIRDLARRAKSWETGAERASFVRRKFSLDVLKGYTLQNYRDWIETRRPNRHWAQRYLDGFRWRVGPRDAQRLLSTDEIYGYVEQLIAASNSYRQQFRWTLSLGAALALASFAYVVNLKLEANETERRTAYISITQKVTASKAGQYPVENLKVAAQALDEARALGDAATAEIAAGNLWEALAGVNELSRATNGNTPETELFSAQFAPDSGALATIDRWGHVARWPFADRRLGVSTTIDAARGPAVQGRSLALSPLGDVAATGYNDGSVRLFDLKSGKPEAVELLINGSKPHASFVLELTFSADGKQLFTASHDGIVWAWSRSKPDGTLAGAAEAALWQPRLVADTRHLGPAPIVGAKPAEVWSLDVNRDATALAFGLELGRVCMVRLAANAQPNCSGAGHDPLKVVKAVKFQPGRDTLVSAGNDDHVSYWRWSMNFTLVPTATRIFEDSDIWDMDFSGDGRLLATASWDGSLRVYDADERRLLARLTGNEQLARSVRFDRSSRLLVSSSYDGTARVMTPFETRASVLDLSYRFPMPASNRPKKAIDSVALGADGTWIAFHDRSRIFVKSSHQEKPESLPLPAPELTSHLAAHPTAPIVAASLARPAINFWTRQASGNWLPRRLTLPGARLEPRPLAISPDGRTLAVAIKMGDTASVLLCPLAGDDWSCSGDGLRKLAIVKRPGEKMAVLPTAIAFSPKGKALAAGGSDGAVRIFDLSTVPAGETLLAGQKDAITTVAFAPDGKSLISTSRDRSLRLWSLADGTYRELKGHKSFVEGAGFSANGKWIASTSQDETVMIWNAATAKPLARLPIERDSILSFDVRQTPRGTLMATGSDSGNVAVLHFFETPQEVLQHAETFLAHGIGAKPTDTRVPKEEDALAMVE